MKFLIVFGPTQEPIDPVRYISNNSTGVMGRELVAAAKRRGHKVTSVECPIDARTALELQNKLRGLLPKNDVLIMAAAVCDTRPAVFSPTKIKKDKLSSVRLVKNPDILADLSKRKKGQVFIGFGLESEKILQNGQKKLKNKSLELIVLQEVRQDKTPFGNKTVKAILLSKNGSYKTYDAISKKRLAGMLVRASETLSKKRDSR